jgi:3-oxoacyl-[acyl-carrier protein] reductase
MARTLFERGAAVLVTGRNAQRGEEVAASLDPTRTRAAFCPLDARSRESFAHAVDVALSAWGRIDVLVNNAGITPPRAFFEIGDDEWDDVLRTNLGGVFLGCQLVGPLLRDQGWGRIVNHASIAGQQGSVVAGAHYAASKAAIIVLTKIVARELARSGVTVNAIAPAAIEGPIMDELDPDVVAALPERIPVGRCGRPEEVAALVAYLCSDEAAYITGATIDINGGLLMR